MTSLFTIRPQGEISERMDLMRMSRAMIALSADHPKATMPDIKAMVLLEKGYGPLTIHRPNSPPQDRKVRAQSEVLVLAPGELVTLQHGTQPGLSWSLYVTPSGHVRRAQGEHATVPVGPTQVHDTAPNSAIINKTLAWFHDGDVGSSSAALAMNLVLIGNHISVADLPEHWQTATAAPEDDGDISRCAKLLAAVPEIRALLPRMADVSGPWADLVSPGALAPTVLEEKIAALAVAPDTYITAIPFRRLSGR